MRSLYLAGGALLLTSAALAQTAPNPVTQRNNDAGGTFNIRSQAPVGPTILAQIPGPAVAPAGGGGGRGPGGTNVMGTIQSFDGTTVTIKAADGTMKSVALAPTATITTSQKVKLSDIKPNDFVATGGTLGADGKIHSNEIRIFPETNRGRGEGSYAMTKPGDVMTNATVTQVMSVPAGGGTMKMSFNGTIGPDGKCSGRAGVAGAAACTGTTDIEVAPDIAVVRQGVGDKTMLKAGTNATVTLTGADGAQTISRVSLTLN